LKTANISQLEIFLER